MKSSGSGFIKNVGQVFDMNKQPCPDVYYQYQLSEAAIFLTKNGLSFAFYKKDKIFEPQNIVPSKTDLITETTGVACRLDVNLVGATILKQNIKEEELNYSAGKMNLYFNDFNEANSNLYYSKKLIVREVYPKIDWVITMNDVTGLKQEFIVHPGASYNDIIMAYDGVNKLTLNEDKDAIYAQTSLGDVNDADLKCFTASGKVVKSSYSLNSKNEVSIQVAKYNNNEDLIIDPQVSLSRTWATYFGGGSDDFIFSNKIDLAKSQLYVAGRTASNPFPPLNLTSGSIGNSDAFVCCFALNGTKLWCNLFGGSNGDQFRCVAVDGNSNVFAAGFSSSNTTTTPIKFPLLNAGGYFQNYSAPLPTTQHQDGTIVKMNFNGVVSWSTLYGGQGADSPLGIFTTSSNDVIICGNTDFLNQGVVNNFPYINAGGYFYSVSNTTTFGSAAFIARFNAATQMNWSTFFRGCLSYNDVTCDVADNIYAVGYGSLIVPELTGTAGSYQQNANGTDAIITKFSPTTNLQWGTNFGGIGGENASSCAINPTDKSLLICGTVSGTATNFPFVQSTGYFNNNFQNPGTSNHGFIAQFNSSHTQIWGTLFSGNGIDEATSVKVGSAGTIFLAGHNKRPTNSPADNFPRLNPGSPFYYDGGNTATDTYDGYIAMFIDVRNLAWSTYYGTTNCDEYTMDIDVSGKTLFYAGLATNNPTLSMITTQQEVGTSWIQTANINTNFYDGTIAKFVNQFNQNLKEAPATQNYQNVRLLNNPILNGEVILLSDNFEEAVIESFILTDLTGKEIKQISMTKSSNEIKLFYGQIANGFYLLNVNGKNFNKSFKVIFN